MAGLTILRAVYEMFGLEYEGNKSWKHVDIHQRHPEVLLTRHI